MMNPIKVFGLCVYVLLYIGYALAAGDLPPPTPPSIAELKVDTTFESAARSQSEKRHFAKATPCPSSGLSVPSCKGYVIDHIVPLCAGGADKVVNMQWQSVEFSKYKDKIEWGFCRCLKKLGKDKCPAITW